MEQLTTAKQTKVADGIDEDGLVSEFKALMGRPGERNSSGA